VGTSSLAYASRTIAWGKQGCLPPRSEGLAPGGEEAGDEVDRIALLAGHLRQRPIVSHPLT
jgi:hypothetical protein